MKIERINGCTIITTHKAWTGRLIFELFRHIPRPNDVRIFAGFAKRS